jgi:hypothetical protein
VSQARRTIRFVGLQVVTAAYGRAASEQLHAAVARAKSEELLAPVTVVVPANSVGVAARRRLATQGRGVVGVTFVTVYRLAELLGAPRCAGARRRPVSTPVVASAVRTVLARSPGIFAPVASHPATEEALVAAHRELSDLDDAQLDVLASQHTRAREVVRVHRATRDALAGAWYDEHDLMRAACDAIEEGSPLVRELGTIVCFLPQRWSTPAARVLRALSERADVLVIAALTGEPRADATVVASLARVGVKLDENALTTVNPEPPTAVVSASDADDEVRAVVREVVDAMRAGVALERMAVCYGVNEPYARLVHEQLEAAGIAHNGGAVRTLHDSVFGAALLRLLALSGGECTRDDVCALFSAAPVLDGQGRPVPAVEWERVSRKAGIVRGGADVWHARIDAYIATLREGEWQDRERARAERLCAFVDVLIAELEPATPPASWREFARWAHRLVGRFLGGDARRASWPVIEQDAARRVEAALDRLGGLDAVDRAPSLDTFRRTLELELSSVRERVGRLGEGILAGPIVLALGVELERVWVCGLAEGVFPSVPNDDALLGEQERAALDGELPLRAERVDDDHRMFLAALASTSGARVCTWPRGDLRRSTEHVPSRFLSLETTTTIPSYAHALSHAEFPPTRHELSVRAAVAGDEWVRAVPAVTRGRALLDGRAGRAFTRFDGNLSVLGERLHAVSPCAAERAISPTRLQLWAGCPHAYFLETVLHVEPVERPEELMQISPLDRGTLVHAVLDQFLAGGARTRERLRTLGEAACAQFEARGVTGRRLLWERDRRVILAELDAFFDADVHWREEYGTETRATELSFGFSNDKDSHPPVELVWPDGRVLRVRGKADRIDTRADGSLVVIDYKSGSVDRYSKLSTEDPVLAGTCLQLPLYARAARAAFGDVRADAYYWFVGRGNDRRIGYVVDTDVEAKFMATVRTIVDGIEAGLFIAKPPPPGPRPFVLCPYCDPDGMGTAERWREWERKYDTPELAPYRELLERSPERGRSASATSQGAEA